MLSLKAIYCMNLEVQEIQVNQMNHDLLAAPVGQVALAAQMDLLVPVIQCFPVVQGCQKSQGFLYHLSDQQAPMILMIQEHL